jgi:hypothetical protein
MTKIVDADSLADVLGMPMQERTVMYEGREYRLREMNEEEGIAYELDLQDKKGKFDIKKMRRTLIAHCWVGPDGKRLVQDAEQLKTLRRSLAGFLFDECQKLNRYDEGELEGLVKNSEEAGSSD